jgi:tetratricopeptide (TPR) repeat protein
MNSIRFKPFFVTLLALAALCLPITQADYELALSEFKKGNYDVAAAAFQTLVEQSPSYDFGHYMLGLCHLKRGKAEAAAEQFSTALQFNSDRFEYFYGLAQALQLSHDNEEAIRTLNRAEKLAGDEHLLEFHYTRGMAHSALNSWIEAIADLELAHGIKSDYKQVVQRLAHSYYKARRYRDAVPFLRESIKIDSGTAANYRLLAESLMASKMDEDEAFEAASSYRALRPGDSAAADLLGRAALAAGRFDEAIAAFSSLLLEAPANCSARINLALALLASDRAESAERTLSGKLDCDTLQSNAYATLGLVQRTRGKYEEALASYVRAYDILPASSSYQAIQEVRHNIEVREFNMAADQDQAAADLHDKQMQDKIDRWNDFIEKN